MIKVGEYLRTPYGIRKIIAIPKHDKYQDDGFSVDDRFIVCGRGAMRKLKTTPNILDLIETGDLMYLDISPDDCGGIVVPRIAETQRELDNYIRDIKDGNSILRGIVTREQIQENIYLIR